MFQIDRLSEKPIYEQIVEQMKKYIMLGLWNDSEPLPSVRALSKELLINPNTLQKAYTELEDLGLCYSEQGTGRFVSPYAIKILKVEHLRKLDDLEKLCSELALAGVPKERVADCVNKAYEDTAKVKRGGPND